jgi:hypothetical protein
MPQRHSKNNNDLAFFTYDEKRKLGYGTQKERLGKDSIKPFDACSLCLKSLIDPMSCQKGHLFCKECILECLLSQKKDIQRYFLNFCFYNNKFQCFLIWLFKARKLYYDYMSRWNWFGRNLIKFFILVLVDEFVSVFCYVDNLTCFVEFELLTYWLLDAKDSEIIRR